MVSFFEFLKLFFVVVMDEVLENDRKKLHVDMDSADPQNRSD